MSILQEYHDQVSRFLDEYRMKDRKNEIISRDYLIALMIDQYPHLGKVSPKALKGMVTALVEKKGGRRLEKANSRHLKYFWPVLPDQEVPL